MTAVILAAVGTHLADQFILTEYETFFQIANHFHFMHAIMLVIVGILNLKVRSLWLGFSGILFIIGILLFSGSLYLLATMNMTEFAWLTPFGGTSLILAWLTLAIAAIAGKYEK